MECGYFTPEIYTAGDGIDITNNVISAEVPENPIHRITLSTFDAAAFTAAQTAHNAGKLVLLDDDTRNFHNLSLLGIYTDFSQETDGQGNPVPFMAFNKVDAWVDGNRSVYDGRNYQLYASGNVYTSNPYLEYTQQSSGPVLNSFWLGYGDEPNQTTLFGLNDAVDGVVQDNKYVFNINAQLSEAINNSTTYGYNIQGNNFGDNGGSQFTWVDETDFHAWVLENGATKMYVAPQGSSQTEVMITVEFDPNWQPPASTVEGVSLVDVSSGNSLYNASNLGITDVGGVWTINGAQLSSALSSGQELDVSISGSNVPSVSNSRVTLAAITDTPNLTATASPWTMTFYPQSSNVYNISLTIGGQN